MITISELSEMQAPYLSQTCEMKYSLQQELKKHLSLSPETYIHYCTECLGELRSVTTTEKKRLDDDIEEYLRFNESYFIKDRNHNVNNVNHNPKPIDTRLVTKYERATSAMATLGYSELDQLVQELNDLDFLILKENEEQDRGSHLIDSCVEEIEGSLKLYFLAIHETGIVIINGLRLLYDIPNEDAISISWKEINSAWACIGSYLIALRRKNGLLPAESVVTSEGTRITIVPFTNRVLLIIRPSIDYDIDSNQLILEGGRSDSTTNYNNAVMLLREAISISCGRKCDYSKPIILDMAEQLLSME